MNQQQQQPHFISLANLPKSILLELPFLVTKKNFHTTKNNEEASSSSWSPIIDGFLGGLNNLLAYTFLSHPINSNPNLLFPSYPSIRRPLDLVPMCFNLQQQQKLQQQQNNNTSLAGNSQLEDASNNNNNNPDANMKTNYQHRRSFSTSTSSFFANKHNGLTDDEASNKNKFQNSFNTQVAPYVEGKCAPSTDIMIKVTYKKTIVRKIVTTVRVVKKKNTKNNNNNNNNNLSSENEEKQTTQSRLVQTSTIDESSFRAEPVGIVKWNIEFRTPADWTVGLSSAPSSSSPAQNSSEIQQPPRILPLPSILSTKPELSRKLFSYNRCQSPVALEAALEQEKRQHEQKQEQQGESSSSSTHRGVRNRMGGVYGAQGTVINNNHQQTSELADHPTNNININKSGRGAIELSGDIESDVPPKVSPNILAILLSPRFRDEFTALRRFFRLYPDCKFLTVDNMIDQLFKVARLKLVDNDEFSTNTTTTSTNTTATTTKTAKSGTTASDLADASTKRFEVKRVILSSNHQNQKSSNNTAGKGGKGVAKAIDVKLDNLKIVSRLATYSFSGGPFRLYRIRFGYDPRKQPRERHFHDQIVMFKTRDVGNNANVRSAVAVNSSLTSGGEKPTRLVLMDCRTTADKIFGKAKAQTCLRNVLLKIRNDFVEEYQQQQQQNTNNNNSGSNNMMMMMMPQAVVAASNSSSSSLEEYKQDFLAQHDLFSRLLLSGKKVFFLCVGDFVPVPKFAKVIEEAKSDTYDSSLGWFTKKGYFNFHTVINDAMYDWIVDVVSPKMSKDAKVTDFFSMKMPTLNAQQQQERRRRNANAGGSRRKKNFNENGDDEEDDEETENDLIGEDEDDVFGSFYTGGLSSSSNNQIMMNHQKEQTEDNGNNRNLMMMGPESAQEEDFSVQSFDEFNVSLDDQQENDDENDDDDVVNNLTLSGSRRQRETTTSSKHSKNQTGKGKHSQQHQQKQQQHSSSNNDFMMDAFGFEDADFDREGGYREKSEEFEL